MSTTTPQAKRPSSIKVAGIVTAAILVVTTLMLKFGVKEGVKGFYMNDYSVYSQSANSRQANADWQKRQGVNLAALYGAAGSLTSTSGKPILADVIYRSRKAGVRSNGFPYSTSSSVVNSLNSYNSSVTDSSKFDFVVSEIEPYNTGDYAGFYTTLRTVNTWCGTKGVQSCVYMGWPSEACWDTIVRNATRIFLHCYKSSTTMSGDAQYGYVKGRMGVIAAKCKALNKKISIVIIHSNEPAFSYTYFQNNTWARPYNDYLSYYSTHATSDMKQFLTQDGYMDFVSKYGKQIKP
mgnify:CR=1 FL=1|jgi:hypothetical protein